MGDRGNIVIKQNHSEGGYLYLYTHYGGSEMPRTLQDALKRGRQCWSDEQYLARVVFSEMIKDNVMDLDCYGISNYIGDNGQDLLVVDVEEQMVSRVHGDDPTATPKKSWSFEKFLEVKVNKEFGYSDDEDED